MHTIIAHSIFFRFLSVFFTKGLRHKGIDAATQTNKSDLLMSADLPKLPAACRRRRRRCDGGGVDGADLDYITINHYDRYGHVQFFLTSEYLPLKRVKRVKTNDDTAVIDGIESSSRSSSSSSSSDSSCEDSDGFVSFPDSDNDDDNNTDSKNNDNILLSGKKCKHELLREIDMWKASDVISKLENALCSSMEANCEKILLKEKQYVQSNFFKCQHNPKNHSSLTKKMTPTTTTTTTATSTIKTTPSTLCQVDPPSQIMSITELSYLKTLDDDDDDDDNDDVGDDAVVEDTIVDQDDDDDDDDE